MGKKKKVLAEESSAIHRAQQKLIKQMKDEEELFRHSSLRAALGRIHKLEERHKEQRVPLHEQSRLIQEVPQSDEVRHLMATILQGEPFASPADETAPAIHRAEPKSEPN